MRSSFSAGWLRTCLPVGDRSSRDGSPQRHGLSAFHTPPSVSTSAGITGRKPMGAQDATPALAVARGSVSGRRYERHSDWGHRDGPGGARDRLRRQRPRRGRLIKTP